MFEQHRRVVNVHRPIHQPLAQPLRLEVHACDGTVMVRQSDINGASYRSPPGQRGEHERRR